MGIRSWIKKSWEADSNIEEVQESVMMSWPSTTIIFIGMWFSMWAVTVGFTVGSMMPPVQAMLACLIGFSFTALYNALVGIPGQKEGLPTVSLIEKYAGKPVSVFFSISTVIIYTWAMGMQADIAGITIGNAVGAQSHNLISGFVAIIMVFTGIIGIAAIKKLSTFVVPLFLGVTILAAALSLSIHGGLGAVFSADIEATMSFGAAVSLATGAWISFATMSPDVTRFVKSPKDVIISSMLSMLIGCILPLIGVILAVTTKVSDIGLTFKEVGLDWIGVLAVFFAAWTTNDNNSYCGGIALSKLINVDRRKATIIIAVGGVILAYLGSGATNVIGASLGWLVSAAGPVGGIIISHYYFLSNHGKKETIVSNWVGIVAFVSGFLLSLLGEGGVWGKIPVPGFILGIVGAALIFWIFSKIDQGQKR